MKENVIKDKSPFQWIYKTQERMNNFPYCRICNPADADDAKSIFQTISSFEEGRGRSLFSIFHFPFSIIRNRFIPLLVIAICSCSPYRYLCIETLNSASITFPTEMRRVLIVNNALPQNDVPFESTLFHLADSIAISADSAAFDFCSSLGEVLADFEGFDDVRLLDGCFRNRDMSPLLAPNLERNEVEMLCEEHETDVVISLDRLLFSINEYTYKTIGIQMQEDIQVDISGVLRVYVPDREKPLTTILLTDTITPEAGFDYDNEGILKILFSINPSNLLRVSARYMATEARKYFIPYWHEDLRWYYKSSIAQWKEATAYAESERWDKALDIWKKLYGRETSWKQRARLCSNIALGLELTGDLEQALQYAKLSHQLMHDRLGADDAFVQKQDTYINVLTSRIIEERRLQLQLKIEN